MYLRKAWVVVMVALLAMGCRTLAKKDPGLILVGSPQVTTRERLVNDRLEQETWLKTQLLASDGVNFETFQEPSISAPSSAPRWGSASTPIRSSSRRIARRAPTTWTPSSANAPRPRGRMRSTSSITRSRSRKSGKSWTKPEPIRSKPSRLQAKRAEVPPLGPPRQPRPQPGQRHLERRRCPTPALLPTGSSHPTAKSYCLRRPAWRRPTSQIVADRHLPRPAGLSRRDPQREAGKWSRRPPRSRR